MKSWSGAALGLLLVACTVAGLVAGNGNVVVALLPSLLVAGMYAVWTLPLRWPLLLTTFLALTLEI